MSYITGNTIRTLREKQNITQKQLAELLMVSDKTVSKWETGRGLPDISLITELAGVLHISVAELLAGEYVENQNRSSNMKRMSYYVCPICGNVIQSVGKGSYSCCGIQLPPLEAENADESHIIQVERSANEYHVKLEHPMTKEHYISFLSYVTENHIVFVKLYPEQSAEGWLVKRGHGYIYAYCNRHGLYQIGV